MFGRGIDCIYEKMKGIIRMKKFDVHVRLVSDQALPNFIPVLAEDFRPQEVILLATEPMKKKRKRWPK